MPPTALASFGQRTLLPPRSAPLVHSIIHLFYTGAGAAAHLLAAEPIAVAVARFRAAKPGCGAAEIEVTTFQNEPLPLLDISVDRCGPTVEDGTLVEGVSRASSCTARVAEIQKSHDDARRPAHLHPREPHV